MELYFCALLRYAGRGKNELCVCVLNEGNVSNFPEWIFRHLPLESVVQSLILIEGVIRRKKAEAYTVSYRK